MSEASDQLYAVLIAVQNDTLLVPNLGIAEIASLEGLRPDVDAPDWFAGRLPWQGQDIPVARFERLNGAPAEPPGRRTRVVVLTAITTRLPGARYGLLCEGYPHLITLNRAVLQTLERRAGDHAGLILSRARVASQETAIPNLEFIEAELAGVVGAAG
jgi:chemosensory pili system protein ChpC